MTKKNAKKVAARARQQIHGGSYQHHLRQVGGTGRELSSIHDVSDSASRATRVLITRRAGSRRVSSAETRAASPTR